MKSRQRASAKRYRIVFGKAQAGVFALVLVTGMGTSFGFGYLWGTSGASNEAAKAEVVPEPEGLKKGKGEEAKREAVAALIKKFEADTEASKKSTDAIKPKFYQDLLKENPESEQPIELIKLPVVKKEIPPQPTPPLAAAVEEPPTKEKPLDEQAGEKKENTNGIGNETPKRVEADPRTSKPWAKASGYTIQVVSVKKFDVALRVVRKLRGAGLQPFIKNADLGTRGRWYRVRVGHYRDKAEAQKALSEMQVRLKLQGARISAM
ncbi:MAG: SPOR domain-containing protein [Nitrospinae bacterium]|nr:SPOR domain-containing protein [Nitrospinota bacterium]